MDGLQPRVSVQASVCQSSARTSLDNLVVEHKPDGSKQKQDDRKHDDLIRHRTAGHGRQDTPRL